ncbi:hypothetical protein H0H87_003606 [Tephrocybe sp. NHM501043]|nr:hypothetical protein H0H87_003606 [Tephrocybe sp. NHM501043]
MSAIHNAVAIFDLPAPPQASALPVPNSTHSFWINTPGANPLAQEGSEGDLIADVDVCIIGSGITGTSAAYHLGKSFAGKEGPALKVAILEARDFCSGATGRNGGHLTAEIFDNFVFRESRYGAEEAKKAHKLEIHTEHELVDLIKAEGWESLVDLVSNHRVGLLQTDKEYQSTKADYDAAKAAKADLIERVEWLTEKKVLELYGSSHPGYKHPGNNVWPLKLVTQLYKLAKRLNPDLNLYTNTPVTSITRSDSNSRRWNLSTHRGNIHSSYVIHATNAYTSHLLPHMHGPKGIIPTRGQAIALRAAAPSSEITPDAWVGTLGWKYWFPRPVSSPEEHPLIILGGGRDEVGPGLESYIIDDSTVNVNAGKALRNYLPPLFPGKYEEGREPEMEWTGIMGYTKVGDPSDQSLTLLSPKITTRGSCFNMSNMHETKGILDLPSPQRFSVLPVPNPTHSFWINTPGANPLAKEGSEDDLTADADVCIIGAGITGVSSAYHLAKSLIEKEGKESQYGTEEAKKTIKLEVHTEQELVSLIKSEGWETIVDLVSNRRVGLLRTDDEYQTTKKDYDAASAARADSIEHVEWLNETEVSETYGSSHRAYRHPGNNLWPLKLVTQLYKLAKKLNPDLKLHTNTPVTSITRTSNNSRRWSLSTPRGEVLSSYVIHATNGYASHLLPHMHGPNGIVPVRAQALALRAAASSAEIREDAWIGTLGWKYWFPRPVSSPDKHPLTILGGGRDESGPGLELYIVDDSTINDDVGKALRAYLPPLFPGKYELGREPEMEWTGIQGATLIGDPFVGPVIDVTRAPDYYTGQYIVAGYTGHGMPRAYACAEAVVGMITAEITGRDWGMPDWFPRHFLTTERL